MRPVAVAVTLVIVACGSTPKVHETTEKEPAWAADYAAATTRACACRDDACIRAERPALDAMIAAHGGIEEAPPSVHEHTQKLEACWVATTLDLARDLGTSADEICGCDSTSCVGRWYESLEKLSIRYGTSDPDELRHAGDARATAAWERAAGCLAGMTISSADYLAVITRTNAELCACTLPDCAKAALATNDAALAKFHVVAPDAGLTREVDAARAEQCKCAKKFPPTTELDTEIQIGGMPVHFEGYFTMGIDCTP
jgi:hypothetical protein